MSKRKQSTGYQRQKLTDAMVSKTLAKEKDYSHEQSTYFIAQRPITDIKPQYVIA